MALQGIDGLGHAFGRGDVTEAPTGHRVGLAEAVHGQGQVVDVLAQRRDADVLRVVVDELFVNFVGKNQDVLVERDVGQAGQFVFRIDGAGRIARRIDDDHLGLRRHRVAELVRRDLVIILGRGRDEDRFRADELGHFRDSSASRGPG